MNLLKDAVQDVSETGTESREKLIHSADEHPTNVQDLSQEIEKGKRPYITSTTHHIYNNYSL